MLVDERGFLVPDEEEKKYREDWYIRGLWQLFYKENLKWLKNEDAAKWQTDKTFDSWYRNKLQVREYVLEDGSKVLLSREEYHNDDRFDPSKIRKDGWKYCPFCGTKLPEYEYEVFDCGWCGITSGCPDEAGIFDVHTGKLKKGAVFDDFYPHFREPILEEDTTAVHEGSEFLV